MQWRQRVGTYRDIIAGDKNARQHPAYPRASQVDGQLPAAMPGRHCRPGIAFTHWRHTSDRSDARPLSPTHQFPLPNIGPP